MTTSGNKILGIGNDIIDIERIRSSYTEHEERLLEKVLTLKEQEYCLKYKDSIPHIAGRFSAKEAIVKALGTGFGAHVSWTDIEILNDLHGKPTAHFSEKLQERLQGTTMHISISHCKLYVTAMAIWESVSLPSS